MMAGDAARRAVGVMRVSAERGGASTRLVLALKK